jgi:hypothetical protein
MSEDEDAPGTWGDKSGFGRPYIPFPCTGLLIPCVMDMMGYTARHWPRSTLQVTSSSFI